MLRHFPADPILACRPRRSKESPFFLGGEVILVSYPTDAMGQADKLMSMRGNNVHCARATVFHELIPGHHLQGFMNERYNPQRREFATPFWSEGNARLLGDAALAQCIDFLVDRVGHEGANATAEVRPRSTATTRRCTRWPT